MRKFNIVYEQINGSINVMLEDSRREKNPIIVYQSVALSQWEEASPHVIAHSLRTLADLIDEKELENNARI
jgi:hypothetical protein